MRRTLMTLGTVGCVAGCGKSPVAPKSGLELRLLHDGGGAAGLNMVIVTQPNGETVTTRTGYDGVLRYPVDVDGAYHVRIVPRSGYHGDTPGLRRDITLDDENSTVVEVTLYRQAQSGGDRCMANASPGDCR